MPKNGDFKRLVRARMEETGERYTTARAAMATVASREPRVTDPTRALVDQLADVNLAPVAAQALVAVAEEERRIAAVDGLRHESWRVRRTCAQLLDRVELTPEAIDALTSALDDPHPQVRRKVVHTLSCERCKPGGCIPAVRPMFERAVHDSSSLVRSMVLHVCSLHFFDQQWAVDLVADMARSDPSAKLRATAADELRRINEQWTSDDRRRQLPSDLVVKTERHVGRWIAIRDGRIVGVRNGQGRVFRREVLAGATPYWVAPPDARRPHTPSP